MVSSRDGAGPLAVALLVLYLGSMGLFFPFLSRYLHNVAGLSMTQVGVIQAVLPLTGIVTQMFWGWIADRTGARRGVLVILTVGAAVGTAAKATAVVLTFD